MAGFLPYQQMSQPQQPAQPAPAQSGVLDQIGHILSHPAVQALMGAYFGAVSSPRVQGWGGAIGHGGLTGLGAYGLAQQSALEQQQRELELKKYQDQQAAIGKLDPRVRPYAQANVNPEVGLKLTAQDQARTLNAKTAATMVQYANQITDPAKKARYNFLASTIANSPDPVDGGKIMEAMSRDDLDAIHAELYKMQIPEAQARTQEALAGVGEKQASAQRSLAEAGAVGPRLGLEEKRVDIEGKRLAAQTGADKQTLERNKQYAGLYKAAIADYTKSHPRYLMGMLGGGSPEEAAQYATSVATAGVAGFSGSPTETAGAPTPYSGTPVSDPNIPPPPPGFAVH